MRWSAQVSSLGGPPWFHWPQLSPEQIAATNSHSTVPCPPVLLPVMNSWREKWAQTPGPTSSSSLSTQHTPLVSALKVGFRPQLQHCLTPSVDCPLHTWPPLPLGSLPCPVVGGGAPHPLPASAWLTQVIPILCLPLLPPGQTGSATTFLCRKRTRGRCRRLVWSLPHHQPQPVQEQTRKEMGGRRPIPLAPNVTRTNTPTAL